MHDFSGVERIRQHVVDLGQILHPLALAPFDLQQTISLFDLTMTIVDVDRQAERADDLLAVLGNQHVTDPFDPVNASVRPDTSVIEAERLASGDAIGDGFLDHRPVSLVDVDDPLVERPTELITFESEEHGGVGVPRDDAGPTVP